MPKFGLKCFLGSFVFSLVAVMAATKAYSVLTQKQTEPEFELANIETKKIELFAHNEESDAIYEKFKQLNNVSNRADDLSAAEQTTTMAHATVPSLNEPAEEIFSETVEFADEVNAAADDSIYYAPDQENDLSEQTNTDANNQNESGVVEITAEEPESTDDAPLTIVDASEAPTFKIPLIHNNMSVAQSDVTVSNTVDTHQVALATDDVDLDNLGTESKTVPQSKSDTQEDDFNDDPWEVAEVANKNIARNQNAEKSAPKNGNAVPYQMQDNLLVPIPEEIKKEKNLTPQFSTSAENKKLEEALRRKREGLPPAEEHKIETPKSLAQKIKEDNVVSETIEEFDDESDDESEKAAQDEAEKESQSLTDSIAAWFSGSDKSTTNKDEIQGSSANSPAKKPQRKETSMFRKLLGLSSTSKSGIAPSELKLSFQPNRAEISGQTLEWIKAFSENVTKYDDVAIEIRIDRSASYELQQKRLKLLYKILANNGVEYQKINIIFTDREPNSFIIRNVRYVTREERAQASKMENNPWK